MIRCNALATHRCRAEPTGPHGKAMRLLPEVPVQSIPNGRDAFSCCDLHKVGIRLPKCSPHLHQRHTAVAQARRQTWSQICPTARDMVFSGVDGAGENLLCGDLHECAVPVINNCREVNSRHAWFQLAQCFWWLGTLRLHLAHLPGRSRRALSDFLPHVPREVCLLSSSNRNAFGKLRRSQPGTQDICGAICMLYADSFSPASRIERDMKTVIGM